MAIPYVENPPWADGSGGGTPINAAKLNLIEQGITDAHLMPVVRAYHNANQSITSGVDTALALNSERYDQVSGAASTMHDTATNNSRLTCRHAGVYSAKGLVAFAGNGTGARIIYIRLNGTTFIGSEYEPGDAVINRMSVVAEWSLAVNDYVELVVNQASGGALDVQALGGMSPEFMMHRVG